MSRHGKCLDFNELQLRQVGLASWKHHPLVVITENFQFKAISRCQRSPLCPVTRRFIVLPPPSCGSLEYGMSFWDCLSNQCFLSVSNKEERGDIEKSTNRPMQCALINQNVGCNSWGVHTKGGDASMLFSSPSVEYGFNQQRSIRRTLARGRADHLGTLPRKCRQNSRCSCTHCHTPTG